MSELPKKSPIELGIAVKKAVMSAPLEGRHSIKIDGIIEDHEVPTVLAWARVALLSAGHNLYNLQYDESSRRIVSKRLDATLPNPDTMIPPVQDTLHVHNSVARITGKRF